MVMATRAVKMNDESRGGSNLPLVNRVTESVQETREFLHDVRVEMKQVTWPNREDVISTTGVVIATVAFFGIFLAIVEWLAQKGLDQLLHYFHV
jgi:preprotein translocase subunit SecE